MSLSRVDFNLERNETFLESTCACCSLTSELQDGEEVLGIYLHVVHDVWAVVVNRAVIDAASEGRGEETAERWFPSLDLRCLNSSEYSDHPASRFSRPSSVHVRRWD